MEGKVMARTVNSRQNIVVRPSNERGHADHGWLNTYHSFSFADYFDPSHMGFRSLRVINDDIVGPATGFGMHPHRDMEILTYVIKGSLRHKDSMGHESVITSGQIQKITAGSGIRHSESNASDRDAVHLLQIWIIPHTKDLTPSYEEHTLPVPDPKNPLLLMGSPEGGNNVVHFNQDVQVYRGVLDKGKELTYTIGTGRGVWVQMVKGTLELGDKTLKAGDGASMEGLDSVKFKSLQDSEFLLFDLG